MTSILNDKAALAFDLAGLGSADLRIGITSALRGEGRTSLACGLAETISQEMGQPVVLVELDFEHPNLAQRYDLKGIAGIAEVLQGKAPLSEVLHEPLPNLVVLHAGAHLQQSLKLTNLLMRDGLPWKDIGKLLKPGFITILDLPPLVDTLVGAQLAKLATHLVMTTRGNTTPAEAVKAALDKLSENGQRDKLVRGVLTATHRATPKRFGKN